MSDRPNEVEQKLIEFASKTAETIQNQAGQIQALSHVLLVSLVSMSEQNPAFKRDFIDRIVQVRDQLGNRPMDEFTREYFEELVKFIENPYNYSTVGQTEDHKPNWFKGIIAGGKKGPGMKSPRNIRLVSVKHLDQRFCHYQYTVDLLSRQAFQSHDQPTDKARVNIFKTN